MASHHDTLAFQLLQNMASIHIQVRKGTCHVFYMVTPSHATESVLYPILCIIVTVGYN